MQSDGRVRLYADPVTVSGTAGRTTLVAVVGTPTWLTDRAEDRVRDVMIVATAPLVALSGLAAWLLSGAALRPVERMRRDAASLAAAEDRTHPAPRPAAAHPTRPSPSLFPPRGGPSGGDAPGPAPELAVPGTRDEIAALARTMNDLLARLHAARLRDRAFIADAGHELRTPLTVLRAELELAARPGRTVAELRTAISGAAEETERLIRLAESLLTLARMDGGRLCREPVDLDDLLIRAARAAAGLAAARGIRLAVEVPPAAEASPAADVHDAAAVHDAAEATVEVEATIVVEANVAGGIAALDPGTRGGRPRVPGDSDLLRQCVDNLLANALRHAPPGSTVDLILTAHRDEPARPGGATRPRPPAGPSHSGEHAWDGPTGEGEVVRVTVRDRGAGFPEAFLPHAFERFRRADAARRRRDGGAGLGLSIVAAIVAAHGGVVSAANHPQGGAVVTMVLPAAGPRETGPQERWSRRSG
ncbi:ATP-binding protein [Frankia sp. AiPa1]|nr:ATP-binding protein [Frankia sp. AiPa1]